MSQLPGEAIAANNVVSFQINPRDAKLRIIYMEGSPLPEYRYIHEALEEDPNITCVSMTLDNMHAAHPRLYRPQLQDRTYRGTLTAPPASEILDSPGSTVHQLTLDVVAFDGNHEAARSSATVQVIDDPAEFRDPRPDHAALTEIARNSGGRVIHEPEELASLLVHDRDASVVVVVRRSPLWDTPLLWLLLMGVLSLEWIVRRRRGLA